MNKELPVPIRVRVLTLIQFMTVLFSVSFVGAVLKSLRPTLLAPPLPDVFATRFSDRGIWLGLLPICWLLWAMFATNRPTTEYRTEPRSLYVVGYAIVALALALGVAGAISAYGLRASYHPTITP